MTVWLLAVLATLASVRDASAQRPRTLTVFAAASLTAPFTELGDSLERRRPGLSVRFNFAGSQQLAAQLAEGAEADIFASADERWMRDAGGRGLLAGTPVIFARNRLVVALPAGNPGRIERLQDLARPGLKLVLAAASVPAGAYGREMLERLSRTAGFTPDFARRALANLASEEENVKAVLAKVQLGEADAGIVYRTDVAGRVASHVRVLEIPEAANVVAEYPAAARAGTAEAADARAFLSLLLGDLGQRVLAAHGFLSAQR